jgi:hypothetical protein
MDQNGIHLEKNLHPLFSQFNTDWKPDLHFVDKFRQRRMRKEKRERGEERKRKKEREREREREKERKREHESGL